MNKKTLIELKNITKTYGKAEAKTYALNDISLKINEGEFIAIMGSSGSGKSTCMNIIGALDTPTSGEYFFNKIDVQKLDKNNMALLRRYYIGFVFQGFNLLGRTTALENVELPLIYKRAAKELRKKDAQEALRKVGLEKFASYTPSELSGGQQQRVAIARAIVTTPILLLADEPTGNLDSTNSIEIMEILKNLNEQYGITIIMVTHEEEMASYANRKIYFKDGQIVDNLQRGRS
ncbi:MAG: ABC transporter ATP-binding protein [Campylobacterota bacterium]|nr:ABC transporter ATP-binding protein [Campylobacterota bacterium]